MSVFLAFVVLFATDSLFFATYSSKAQIMIPAHEDSSLLERRALDVQTNERFLATQRAGLVSQEVIGNALAAFYPDERIGPEMIQSLRRDLSIERIPFDNTMTLRLRGEKSHEIQQLLGEIIKSYQDWFRSGIMAETMRLQDSLASELASQRARLACAPQIFPDRTVALV